MIGSNLVSKAVKANKFRKAQSEMMKQVSQIFATNEHAGMKVVVRGDKRIERLEINGEERKDIKDLINNAFKDVEKKSEKKMRGQLSESGLGDLLEG